VVLGEETGNPPPTVQGVTEAQVTAIEDQEVDSDVVVDGEDNAEDQGAEANDEEEDSDEDGVEDQTGVPWADLSASVRCWRCEAVCNRMGQFVLSLQTIFDHLEHANGSVDDAITSLKRAHDRAITNAPAPAPAGELELPNAIRGLRIRYFATADQERRAAVDIIPLLANRGRDPANQVVLSRAQAALLLELANGDMDQVVVLLQNFDESMNTLHHQYDGLRALTGTEEKRQEQADAMVAHLVHITDRPDWYSVGLHLGNQDWDLVKAVSFWQEIGILPQKHRHDKPNVKKEGKGRRLTRGPTGLEILPMPTLAECTEYVPRTDITWGPEPAQFATTTGPMAAQAVGGLLKVGAEERKKRRMAFVIHHDLTTAKVNCPDESKMLIEYMAGGQYRTNCFKSNAYRWPEFPLEHDEDKPLFNFAVQTDVRKLNNWTRLSYARITGMIKQQKGASWSAEEKAHLHEICAILYEESRANNEDQVNLRIPDSVADAWVVEYKAKFGTDRTAKAIVNMARRDPEVCKDFGVALNVDKSRL
jgi:hypothetical protein